VIFGIIEVIVKGYTDSAGVGRRVGEISDVE